VEITSLHWSSSLLHREQARNTRTENPQFTVPTDTQPVFEVGGIAPSELDYSAVSPRLLREVALQKYVAGQIPQDVYIALAQELPMEAVDSAGTVLDLSGVTDDTEFDFQSYFREQRDLASALGDGENALTFTSVLDFMRS
jgi:hypothetical protein